MRKGFAQILIVGIVLAFAILGISIYFKQTQKPLNVPNQITTPKPASSSVAPASGTVNWKTYTNTKYTYTVSYPSNIQLDENLNYSVLFNKIQNQPGAPGFPTYYISVIPDGFWENGAIYNDSSSTLIKSLTSLKVGEKSTDGIGQGAFVRLSDILINSKTTTVYENTSVWAFPGKDRRVLVKNSDKTYMIGAYYNTEDELNNFKKFLSTFKFTN